LIACAALLAFLVLGAPTLQSPSVFPTGAPQPVAQDPP
jgi:hypothetical protein